MISLDKGDLCLIKIHILIKCFKPFPHKYQPGTDKSLLLNNQKTDYCQELIDVLTLAVEVDKVGISPSLNVVVILGTIKETTPRSSIPHDWLPQDLVEEGLSNLRALISILYGIFMDDNSYWGNFYPDIKIRVQYDRQKPKGNVVELIIWSDEDHVSYRLTCRS